MCICPCYQTATQVSEQTYHTGQVVHDFYLSDEIFGLSKIVYNIIASVAYIIHHNLIIWRPFSLYNCFESFVYFCVCAIFYKKSLVFRKSACPLRHVQTKMYLSERPFFNNSLAGASGQVLMLVPDLWPCFYFTGPPTTQNPGTLKTCIHWTHFQFLWVLNVHRFQCII